LCPCWIPDPWLAASAPQEVPLLVCDSKPLLPPDVVLDERSEKTVAGMVLLTWRLRGKFMVARCSEYFVDSCLGLRKAVCSDLLTLISLASLFPSSPENSNFRLTVSGPHSPA